MKALAAELKRLRAQHLYRVRNVIEGPQGPHLVIDGKKVLAFCSNDYLGLAQHPQVVAALQQGAALYGVGSGASHLITGHSRAHHALEEALAAYTHRPRALLFSTGYMANLGVVAALSGRRDTIYEDRLNHASLLDAGLLAQARLRRYAHNDLDALQTMLAREAVSPALIISDGVFSMDGDLVQLPQLAALALRHGAGLMIDDAHGLGVIGTHGGGVCEHFQVDATQVPILVGTLGKAFGTFGAFVAGSDELIETLIQQARTYIYTTALPPAIAHATLTSLQLIEHESWRRQQLASLVQRFRRGAQALGLTLLNSETPIQPLLLGDAARAMAWSAALLQQDILVKAIRPPTVPKGTARLRITFSAAHSESDVDRLLAALERLTCDSTLNP